MTELQKQAKPVLHVPRGNDPTVLQCVKLMQTEAHLFARGGDAKQLAEVGAGYFSPYGDLTRGLNHVVDDDAHIWKRVGETADNRFDALGAWALPGCQGDVIPVGSQHAVDEVGIVLAERAVEGLNGLAFGLKAGGKFCGGHRGLSSWGMARV